VLVSPRRSALVSKKKLSQQTMVTATPLFKTTTELSMRRVFLGGAMFLLPFSGYFWPAEKWRFSRKAIFCAQIAG
jgi:hypothetical protein